jgi:FAD/FMN-containing dehydrogenase
MVGNNSSGTTSIRYGARDKIVEIKAILSDGSAAVFADLSPAEFMAKRKKYISSIYKIFRNFRIKKLKTK